jgi:hypothetical protein
MLTFTSDASNFPQFSTVFGENNLMRNMKIFTLLKSGFCLTASVAGLQAATLTINENWGANYDAASWGSNWSAGANAVTPSILPSSLGGTYAGNWSASSGNMGGQSMSRSFYNATGFGSLTDSYYIQFAAKITQGDSANSGAFIFTDGTSYSSGAATVGFSTSVNQNPTTRMDFYARDYGTNSSVFLKTSANQNLTFKFGMTYVFDIKVNPIAGLNQPGYNPSAIPTYSVTVSELDSAGNLVTSASSGLLQGDKNAFNNAGSTKNLYFFNSTQNNRDTTLDRITVSTSEIPALVVPEPAAATLVGLGALGLLWRRQRKK